MNRTNINSFPPKNPTNKLNTPKIIYKEKSMTKQQKELFDKIESGHVLIYRDGRGKAGGNFYLIHEYSETGQCTEIKVNYKIATGLLWWSGINFNNVDVTNREGFKENIYFNLKF